MTSRSKSPARSRTKSNEKVVLKTTIVNEKNQIKNLDTFGARDGLEVLDKHLILERVDQALGKYQSFTFSFVENQFWKQFETFTIVLNTKQLYTTKSRRSK
jgi:hypothetical protein